MYTIEEAKALCILLIGGGLVLNLLVQFLCGQLTWSRLIPQPPKLPEE